MLFNNNNVYFLSNFQLLSKSFQGGQYILNLVDYFGGTFIIVFLASFEVIAISWVYGNNLRYKFYFFKYGFMKEH